MLVRMSPVPGMALWRAAACLCFRRVKQLFHDATLMPQQVDFTSYYLGRKRADISLGVDELD